MPWGRTRSLQRLTVVMHVCLLMCMFVLAPASSQAFETLQTGAGDRECFTLAWLEQQPDVEIARAARNEARAGDPASTLPTGPEWHEPALMPHVVQQIMPRGFALLQRASGPSAGAAARPPPPIRIPRTQGTRNNPRPGLGYGGPAGEPEPEVYRWDPLQRNAAERQRAQRQADREARGIAEPTASNRVAVGTWNSGKFRQGRLTECFRGGAYHVALAQAGPSPAAAVYTGEWLSR